MMSTKDKARALLRDAIISLCREAIPHEEEIAVEGLLGITIDSKDVFLVTIHDSINVGLLADPHSDSDSQGFAVENSVEKTRVHCKQDVGLINSVNRDPSRRKRKRCRKQEVGKRLLKSDGSAIDTNSEEAETPKESFEVLGERVEIKQEKIETDEEVSTRLPGNWELCLDQGSTEIDTDTEVVDISTKNATNFSTVRPPYPSPNRKKELIRLHEFSADCGSHRPHLIPPTAKRSHPQKRCRVCYKQGQRKESRYCCPNCPGYPGLCVVPCFEMYHIDHQYRNAGNTFLSLQEVEAGFEIEQAIQMAQKHQIILKEDSIGRRTILATNYDSPLECGESDIEGSCPVRSGVRRGFTDVTNQFEGVDANLENENGGGDSSDSECDRGANGDDEEHLESRTVSKVYDPTENKTWVEDSAAQSTEAEDKEKLEIPFSEYQTENILHSSQASSLKFQANNQTCTSAYSVLNSKSNMSSADAVKKRLLKTKRLNKPVSQSSPIVITPTSPVGVIRLVKDQDTALGNNPPSQRKTFRITKLHSGQLRKTTAIIKTVKVPKWSVPPSANVYRTTLPQSISPSLPSLTVSDVRHVDIKQEPDDEQD